MKTKAETRVNWYLHSASEHGLSFRTGYLDDAALETVIAQFLRAAKPVLELAPFGVTDVGIELHYGGGSE